MYPNGPTLFEMPAITPEYSRTRRERAMRRALEHANQNWVRIATNVICDLAFSRQSFTTDDVWTVLETAYPSVTTQEPRALGPLMRSAARQGLIRATGGYIPSTRPACNARPIMVWECKP